MKVLLSSHGDTRFGQDRNRDCSPFRIADGRTIDDLKKIVKAYIEEFDLMEGNWNGGKVWDEKAVGSGWIGRIDYDGKFRKY